MTTTWDFAKYATQTDEPKQDLDLEQHEFGEQMLTAELPELAAVHVETDGGKGGFSRVQQYDHRLIGERLEAEGQFGIRIGDNLYLWGNEGSPRLADTTEFIRFVLGAADPADVPDLLAAVFPDYSVRATGVEAVGEKLGMTRADARAKFLTRKPRNEKKLSVMPAHKAPVTWQRLPDGAWVPQPQRKG